MNRNDRNVFQIIWKTWDTFWQETSIPGVVNAGKARTSILRRVIWLAIFGVMFYYSMDQVVNVIDDFLSYPVTTSVLVSNPNRVSI